MISAPSTTGESVTHFFSFFIFYTRLPVKHVFIFSQIYFMKFNLM